MDSTPSQGPLKAEGGEGRGRDKREEQRAGSMRRILPDIGGGRGHKPRSADSLWKLEKGQET